MLWIKRRMLMATVIFMVILLIGLFFAPRIFITIYPGQAGVLFRTFGKGTVIDKHFEEGLNLILPWNRMYIYNVRLQEKHRTLSVLTKDGLMVETEVSIRFSPNISTLGILHKHIGPNYASKVVLPEVESRTRNIISSFDLEELYSTDRRLIQQTISDSVLSDINDQVIIDTLLTKNGKASTYIIFENLFIKNIKLPDQVAERIEKKIVAEQEFLTYEYILQSEQKEATRKRIEAGGIDSFQIVSKIPILKWRGLEVTEQLSKSPNSKLILLGTDENLPIILNGEVPPVDSAGTQ